MALKTKHNDIEFGVGDVIRVHQRIVEAGKKDRIQTIEGTVIGIKGHGTGKSFTLRRIGTANIGIELIFPVASPLIDKIEVLRKGTKGVRHAKLYYLRDKSRKETERIYARSTRRSTA